MSAVADEGGSAPVYPLEYEFKVIGLAEGEFERRVRALVEAVLGELPAAAIRTRPSAQGKYLSVTVTALLRSEEERRGVFQALHADGRVLYLL